MSGLEILGLVAAIVSAYTGAATVYQDWRKGRRTRKKESANDRLQQLVQSSGQDVQRQYDEDFRRLGQIFARGDELGRTALMEQLITLQQTVISLLTNTQGSKLFSLNAIHPHHSAIEHGATTVRQNSMRDPVTTTPTPSKPLMSLKFHYHNPRGGAEYLAIDVSPTKTFGALMEQAQEWRYWLFLDSQTTEWKVYRDYKHPHKSVRKARCWNETLEQLGIEDGDNFKAADGRGFYE